MSDSISSGTGVCCSKGSQRSCGGLRAKAASFISRTRSNTWWIRGASCAWRKRRAGMIAARWTRCSRPTATCWKTRSEEHTSELQSHSDLVCRLLLEKKKIEKQNTKDEEKTMK